MKTSRFVLCIAVAATACQKEPNDSPAAAPPEFLDVAALPPPADPTLAAGREIYLSTCARCHRRGKAGAPRIGVLEDWAERLGRGEAVLVEHALNGFESPAGNEMPARGGDDDLTDDQVTHAVRFMISTLR